jgi:outer membrane protein
MEAAAREIAVQRGRGLPTLSLSATGTRVRQDQTIGGNQTFDTVGISFSWPLFQGGAVASGVRQVRARYGQAAAQYEAAQRNTERQTRSAYRGVVSGIQRIAAARRAVESGRDAVEASRRNVEFGTGNEFNLLSAQNNFYAAQRAYNQARYDYLTSELTLARQAGRLAEQDLAAIDALLVPHGT